MKNLIGLTISHYEIRQLYGRGGMGAVYRAYDMSLRREVAFKVIALANGDDVDGIKRFEREAQIAASLEHTHIVPIYGFGHADDITYVVMRLMTGGSLSERISQRSQALPSLKEITELLRQISGALDYAHSKGVIHRDIKAGNVLFDNQGGAYLADFGIAKVLSEDANLTMAGALLGTPSHISSELWAGDKASPASDLYAVGIMVYEMLTGDVPFSAETLHGLINKHLYDTPTPPQQIRTDIVIPQAVTQVIEKVLSKDPLDRYPSVTAFAHAFEQACEGAETGQKILDNLFTFKLDRASLVPTHPRRPDEEQSHTAIDKIDPPTARGQVVAPPRPTSERTTWTNIFGVGESGNRNMAYFLGAIGLLLAILVGAFFLSRPDDEPEIRSEPILAVSQSMTVHEKPGDHYPAMAQLSVGRDYPIVGQNEAGDWFQIQMSNGRVGWVAAAAGEASGDLNRVEIVLIPTETPTHTPIPTDTSTNTPTTTVTPSTTPTDTPSATFTPSDTPTDTPSATFTPSDTPTETPSATSTPSDTPTETPSATLTPTATLTSTETPTFTPSHVTLTPSHTPTETLSPTPAISPTPTAVTGIIETGGNVILQGVTIFREGPGEDFNAVVTLSEGTFPITGSLENDERWYQVNLEGQLAWVGGDSANAVFKPQSITLIEPTVPTVVSGVELTYGQTIDSRLERNSQTEFIFQGQAGEVVSIAVLAAEFDSRLELLGTGSPLPLVTDDDSGGNQNALINGFTLQTDDKYRIVVRGYGASDEGSFRLVIQAGVFVRPDENRPVIDYGQTLTDSIGANEEKRYPFKGSAGDVISIRVTGGFDSYVQLLNAAGDTLIDDDDSGGNLNPLIEFYELPVTGEYTIVLRGATPNSLGSFQVTLLKSFTANTTTIRIGETLNGLLSPNGSVAFLFTGEENQRITIRVNSQYDLKITLRDSLGGIVTEDDDSGGNFQPLIEDFRLLADGDYIIVVTGYGEADAGAFTILLEGE